MAGFIRVRLGVLMFLQYFMMGSWFVPFGTYMSKGLGFDAAIGLAYGSQGVAAILSTLVVGTIADRWIPGEKLLAALFLLSSLSLGAIALEGHGVRTFLALTFVHFLVFIPTIPLANSICFHWLVRPEVQFPRIRAIGTIGWITSGLVIGSIAGATQARLPLLIGASAGLLLAAYSLSLPPTPPRDSSAAAGLRALLGVEVLGEQARRPFWILLSATFLIMLPMAFYYAYCNNFLVEAGATITALGRSFDATAVQSLGQASELVFLLFVPTFLRHLGIRGVFMIGIASWAVRYALFAFAFDGLHSSMWMLLVGVLLHGAANDFIQVAGQVYVNESFSSAARARAQALFTTVLMGVGTVVGSALANSIYVALSPAGGTHNWKAIWLIPAGVAMLALGWFGASFHQPRAGTAAPAAG